MPIRLADSASTLLIRREAFERSGISRATIDQLLGLTDEEFRVEGDLIAIGPVFDGDALTRLIEALEERGAVYFDDYFELSGNWPAWMTLFAMNRGPGQ